MLKKIFAISAISTLMAGCTALGTLNAVLPKDDNTAEVIKDVSYGTDPRQQLDIYLPEKDAAGESGLPVVVFLYGGSWSSGDKAEYGFVGYALNSKNIIVVIADYRLVPDVRYPDFVVDAVSAVSWVADNIEKHGGDTNNIFVAGHSAGAYNAVMAGLAGDSFREGNNRSPKVAGVIGLAGPYDFLPIKYPATRAAFEGVDDLEATQPERYLEQTSPPILLMYGIDDITVDPRHSKTMHARATEKGSTSELHAYPDIGHARLVLSLARPFRKWAPTLEDIDRFITKNSS